jgi:hypothetical protein
MKSHRFLIVLLPFLLSLAIHGCSDNPGDSGKNRSVSFALRYGSTPAKVVPDSISLDTVKILLRRIRFRPMNSDDSVDVVTPPNVVRLAVDGSLNTMHIFSIANGTYDRIRFGIHKPEDGEVLTDPEFVAGTERFSVIIKGRLRDTSFVFKSRINADQEVTIDPPLVVDESLNDVNATILVDPAVWFRSGGGVIDPLDPANADLINENIKHSFVRAIRDDNRDGRDD